MFLIFPLRNFSTRRHRVLDLRFHVIITDDVVNLYTYTVCKVK
jgi:hypothetical protein